MKWTDEAPGVPDSGVLVLGIGNILMRDDGVGVRAVDLLRSTGTPPGVMVVDGGTCGADLVDLLADRDRVIVMDAGETGGPPGTVTRCVGLDAGVASDGSVSLHDIGLPEALRMAGILGCAPRELVLFIVQPERVEPGLELSSPVRACLPELVRAVRSELGASA